MQSLSREGSALLFSYLIYIYKQKNSFPFLSLLPFGFIDGEKRIVRMYEYIRNRGEKFFFFFLSQWKSNEIILPLTENEGFIQSCSNSSLFQYFSEIIVHVYTRSNEISLAFRFFIRSDDTRSLRSFRISFRSWYFAVNLCGWFNGKFVDLSWNYVIIIF